MVDLSGDTSGSLTLPECPEHFGRHDVTFQLQVMFSNERSCILGFFLLFGAAAGKAQACDKEAQDKIFMVCMIRLVLYFSGHRVS